MDCKILRLIFAGCYMAIFDPRGTIDSTGTPSEGGYYLDAEAVLEQVKRRGFEEHQIYVSGCGEGAAMGCPLLKKHNVNFIAENPFDRLEDLVTGISWWGRLMINHIKKAIQSKTMAIITQTGQNFFNLIEHLQNVKATLHHRLILLIHTTRDRTNPPKSISNLYKAIHPHKTVKLRINTRRCPDSLENGHMQPPSEDPNMLNWLIRQINQHQRVLQNRTLQAQIISRT